MPTKSYVVGKGVLKITTPDKALDLAVQVTSAKITPSVKRDDDIVVLSGATIAGATNYTATLEFTALQDLTANGVIDYSWKNAGQEVQFEFSPAKQGAMKFAGAVIIDPITAGGDVNARATSEVKWNCIGMPSFTPASA